LDGRNERRFLGFIRKRNCFEGVLQPVKVSCTDHEGARTARIQTWDGKNWSITSDWYTADDNVVLPIVKEAAAKYAAEKKVTVGCLTN
jgi:branched-chain amino acid transport system substrate-binding protein